MKTFLTSLLTLTVDLMVTGGFLTAIYALAIVVRMIAEDATEAV